jgi:hypothetical protein
MVLEVVKTEIRWPHLWRTTSVTGRVVGQAGTVWKSEHWGSGPTIANSLT